MHGQDHHVLLASTDRGAHEATVADCHSDPERQAGGHRPPSESGPLQEQSIVLRQLIHLHVASVRGQHAVISGDAYTIAGTRREEIDGLAPGGKYPGDQVWLPIRTDHPHRLSHERIDPPPPVGGGNERIAGDAGIRCIDPPILRAGVPFVDRRIILRAGIGADPRSPGDSVPQIPGFDGLGDLAVRATSQGPVSVLLEKLEKLIGDTDAVVRVLPGNGLIPLPVPIGVVFLEIEMGKARLGEGKHSLDVGFGHHGFPRSDQGLVQGGIPLRVNLHPGPALSLRRVAGLEHRVQPLGADLGPGDHGGDFLFFDHFPVNELFHVRMIQIQADHLGGASRGSPGFDRARRAIADLEEGHETRRLPTP